MTTATPAHRRQIREQLARAIKRASDEHGLPNTFYPRELWLDYGGPHQIIIGSLLRSAPHLADVARQAGVAIRYEPPTGTGHRDGHRVVVSRTPAAPTPEERG